MDNRVEGFGCAPVPGVRYSAFTMTISANVKTHGGFLSGNIASTYEGLNPTGPSAPSSTNSYIYFDIQMQIENYDHQGWFEHTSNAAFQDSQPPANIPDAQLVKGSKAVSVPTGAAAGSVQTGMSIADGSGLIPLGATVVSVTERRFTAEHHHDVSSRQGFGDRGDLIPRAQFNRLVLHQRTSRLNHDVLATNEVITGTINPVPQVNGSGTIELIDPATVKDGVFVTGVPGADQVLTASSRAAAGWAGPQGNATVLTSCGTFAIPSGATRLRITCVGGGGGGGGGAAGVAGKTQAGGAGGASGCTSEQEVPVGTNKSLTVSIGAGGSAGAGGTGTGRGSAGGPGGNTAVTATGVLVVAQGGPGGSGSPNGSAVPVEGGAVRRRTRCDFPTAPQAAADSRPRLAAHRSASLLAAAEAVDFRAVRRAGMPGVPERPSTGEYRGRQARVGRAPGRPLLPQRLPAQAVAAVGPAPVGEAVPEGLVLLDLSLSRSPDSDAASNGVARRTTFE